MMPSGNPPTTHAAPESRTNDRLEALVVFVGYAECRYLRWLRQGFKHCFVALHIGDRWVICDSLKNRIEFSQIKPPHDFSLGQFYRKRGHTVIAGYGYQQGLQGSAIPEILTCVTVVKRIIGLRSFWTFTPWQLFSLLNSMDDHWHLVE